MKSEDIINALENINDEFIKEAQPKITPKHRLSAVKKTVLTAACAAAVAAILFPVAQKLLPNDTVVTPTQITYETNPSETDGTTGTGEAPTSEKEEPSRTGYGNSFWRFGNSGGLSSDDGISSDNPVPNGLLITENTPLDVKFISGCYFGDPSYEKYNTDERYEKNRNKTENFAKALGKAPDKVYRNDRDSYSRGSPAVKAEFGSTTVTVNEFIYNVQRPELILDKNMSDGEIVSALKNDDFLSVIVGLVGIDLDNAYVFRTVERNTVDGTAWYYFSVCTDKTEPSLLATELEFRSIKWFTTFYASENRTEFTGTYSVSDVGRQYESDVKKPISYSEAIKNALEQPELSDLGITAEDVIGCRIVYNKSSDSIGAGGGGDGIGVPCYRFYFECDNNGSHDTFAADVPCVDPDGIDEWRFIF